MRGVNLFQFQHINFFLGNLGGVCPWGLLHGADCSNDFDFLRNSILHSTFWILHSFTLERLVWHLVGKSERLNTNLYPGLNMMKFNLMSVVSFGRQTQNHFTKSGRWSPMGQHLQVIILASDWWTLITWPECATLIGPYPGLLPGPHLASNDHHRVPWDGHTVWVHHHVLLCLPPCSPLCPFEQHSGDKVVSSLVKIFDKPESEVCNPQSKVWVQNMSPKSQIKIFK